MKSICILFTYLTSTILIGQDHTLLNFTINSEYLNQKKKIWVSLPKHHKYNNYKYHTLYLLDADVGQMAQTVRSIRNELFEQGGYIRPLIIVGIEQSIRNRELSPYGKTGAKFLKYITKEVVPLIDSTFNTIPDRIIAGHSLGGYFGLYVWMESELINSCFAFSPAIYNKDNQITTDLNNYLIDSNPKGFVYVNNGTETYTEKRIKEHVGKLNQVFRENTTDSLFYNYKEYKGYGHNFTPIVGITDALLFHFSHWSIDDDKVDKLWSKDLEPFSTINKFYEKINKWAGFEMDKDNDLYNNLAAHYNRTDDSWMALKLINAAITIDPTDFHSHFVKGEILNGTDRVAAKEAYTNALIYLEPEDFFESTPNFQAYKYWKNRIVEKLMAHNQD